MRLTCAGAIVVRAPSRPLPPQSGGYRIRLRDGQRAEFDVYHLTHLPFAWSLEPRRRFQASYQVGDPRVRRMMEALIDLEGEDVGWHTFFAEESSPV